MSSGFTGGGSEFYASGGFNRRSISLNNQQMPFRSQPATILGDPVSQILNRRPDLIGKRSLAEFQAQQQHHQHQQQQALGLYLRNVKQRTYQHHSPIDFSGAMLPDISSVSQSLSSSPAVSRYGFQALQQQFRQQNGVGYSNLISNQSNSGVGYSNLMSNQSNSGFGYSNLLPNRVVKQEQGQVSETNMMNQLQELEKQLLDDNDGEGEGDGVSVVTNSEWSDTIQQLISPTQKPFSSSPTSSSSSCSTSAASLPAICPKQSLAEAASAISDGKTEAAAEILTRLNQIANLKGTSEQRLTAYLASALRSRVNPTEFPPPVMELYAKEHSVSTRMLYEASPCFKLGFVAANLAIMEATAEQPTGKLHVVDFEIGHGGQYVHLIQAIGARKSEKQIALKMTTFADSANGSEERLRAVGDGLRAVANKAGICFSFNVVSVKLTDLSSEALGVEKDETLAVNFAFRLYKLPDESVTTENLRDDLLRRVKGLSPSVVTVVEQETNTNTAPFVSRVTEACGYYGALFDSLDATMGPENSDRVRIEEGLGRKAANSVACEGRDRVERCEVFGKWRARMGMAGFKPEPLSSNVTDSVRTYLNSMTRGNTGFTVKEVTGGVHLGWKERTIAVASAWR